uniref:Heat shock 70 kDa protein 12A n=1 Tax=Capitella teleta TaxID=283909 RepID=X2B8D8_CAPTE
MSAALDIGTTFSGYAYSFKGREKDIEGCKNWGANVSVCNHKTPTAVLVNKDGKFEAFGYEAQERYKSLEEDELQMYSLYERFKMQLKHTEKLNRDSMSMALDQRSFPLMDIFTMTIRYLKDHLLKSVNRGHGRSVDSEKIRWVITVPAIWSGAAKQFMREAASKAGVRDINRPMQLIIALEPEVAGLYVASKYQTSGTSSRETDAFRPGLEYVVMDCGGGTIDITSYKIQPNQTLNQIYEATGSSFGGTKVDDAFVEFLSQIAGLDVVSTIRQESPIDWLQLMITFDHKKKTIQNKESDKLNIEIPYSMHEIAWEVTGRKLSDIVNNQRIPGVKCNKRMLIIDHDIIQDLFRNPVQEIVNHMKKLMRLPQLKNVSTILMVGGFSESPILQAAVKEAFGKRVKVLIPDDASLCVLHGAVAFGHNPNIVSSRVSRMTYGQGVMVTYDPEKHEADKQRAEVIESIERQTNMMLIYVKRGEVIKVGQVKEFTSFPVRVNQTQIDHEMYCTEKSDVGYVDEEGVEHVGSWTTPLEGKGLDREIKVRVFFGETELVVQTRQIGMGDKEWVQRSFDFLSS